MTVVGPIVVFVLLLVIIWTLAALLSFGVDGSRMNRQIKDLDGPAPDELRNISIVRNQFVTISVVSLVASVLAGIGGALFVDAGKLRVPSSQAPVVLIGLALFLIEFTGILIGYYVTRPTQAWVRDCNVFRSYLRQINARGWVGESELADIRERQSRWSDDTNVRPLHNPHELRELGLELPRAYEEWISPVRHDPAQFGAKLRDDVTERQVRRWIRCKRLWQLRILPLLSGATIGFVLAGTIRAFTHLNKLAFWVLLFPAIAFCCILMLYWLAFRAGRIDLVLINRRLALERKQLHDCDQLISQIERWRDRERTDASQVDVQSGTSRSIIRIGQWDLCLRYDGISSRRKV
jgi:hypothetical protein